MADRNRDCHCEHGCRGDDAANIEQQQAMTKERCVRISQQGEIAGDKDNANLRRPENSLRELELGKRVGGEIALRGKHQEPDEHGESRLPVQQPGEAQAAHQGRRAEDVDNVVDIKAIARALLMADPRQRSVEAVTEPVEDDACNDSEERVAIEAGQRVEHARTDLRGKAKPRELIRSEPARSALGHPYECTLLDLGGDCPVYAACGDKDSVIGCSARFSDHGSVLLIWFACCRSASDAERSVNSSDSRGMLSTKGRIIQAIPVGIERVSETDSIWIARPRSRSS